MILIITVTKHCGAKHILNQIQPLVSSAIKAACFAQEIQQSLTDHALASEVTDKMCDKNQSS